VGVTSNGIYHDIAAAKCGPQGDLVKAIGDTRIQVKPGRTRQSGDAPHNRPYFSEAAKVEHFYRTAANETICAKNCDS
jgi:hypothetical protein